MRRLIGIVVVAVAVWVGLAAGGGALLRLWQLDWATRDLERQAGLLVSPGEAALQHGFLAGDRAVLARALEALPREEPFAGATACDAVGATLAATPGLPEAARCEQNAAWLRGGSSAPRSTRVGGGRGELLLTALPVRGLGGGPAVVVANHFARAQRRVNQAMGLLWLELFLAALVAGALAVVVSRAAGLGLLAELRAIFTGQPQRSRFVPLRAQVHALVDELRREREDLFEGEWGPERLKQLVTRRLPEAKVMVVANREPYIHQRKADGTIELLHPASGLVTALEPVIRTCGGVWVAHGSGSADRDTCDARGRLGVPPDAPAYTLKRVWLSAEEEAGYYAGYANEGLWPLCHQAHERPSFRGSDYAFYRTVNQRFADATAEEAGPSPVVLVQDYHFALLPRMLKRRLPQATVVGFWHIPWPTAERFGICPTPGELLDGMLGCDAIGFHTQQHCNNFLESCERHLEARVDRDAGAVVRGGKTTLVRAWPISVEWPNRWAQKAPPLAECRSSVRAALKLPPEVKLGVGVDRLDYTKGIEERLLAVERLFQRWPELKGRFCFVQLAAPSRTTIPRYQALGQRVDELVERVNREQGSEGVPAVILLKAHHEPPDVFRHYRAADLCYVSSLHDGMNLVAKEFVAARDDEQGVLVLSHFAGAARELPQALVVNPYDLEQASQALHDALKMSADEQRVRMRAMRSRVREYNVYRWAGRMLIEAARLVEPAGG